VLARAAQLWSSRDLAAWPEALAAFGTEGSLTAPIAVARAAARPAGRTDAIARLEGEVVPLVEHVIGSRTAEWEAAICSLASRMGFGSENDLRPIRLNVRDWLAQATFAVLSVEVVADVTDKALRLSARGPWLAAVNPGKALPGAEWSAGTRVVRAVRRQLRPLTGDQWAQLVRAHDHARRQGGADNAYNDLCWRLYFMYSTSAAGMPWSKLADLPAAGELGPALRLVKEWHAMVEWASCLAALLTHRAHFCAEDVATFVRPVVGLTPDLERVANAVR
jgi:hypothetical protein